MNSRIYDILKYTALIALPALATFWAIVSPLWGFPYTDQVVTTIVALNTLLGALIGVSAYQHNKAQ